MIRGIGNRRAICQALFAVAALIVMPDLVLAQMAVTVVPAQRSAAASPQAVTVTGSSAAALAAGTYVYAALGNQSGADTVRCRWGSTAVNADTAGQFTILPYSAYVWDAVDPPPVSQALNCISSGSSTPVTVRAY